MAETNGTAAVGTEEQAVDKAKVAADSTFRPPASILNAATAAPLLAAVDGPSLKTYEGKESVYAGRSVPIAAGAKMDLPIHVTSPGSVVSYSIELAYYDIDVAVQAERDDGITIIKENTRIEQTDCPLTQKFLVGSVPCVIQFQFNNEFSWFREKVVTYRITVTPPSRESLIAGRRRRATSCLIAVEEDLNNASQRLQVTQSQKRKLQEEVAGLMRELEEKKKSWQVAEKEEQWLSQRLTLRKDQESQLKQRLNKGWGDE